MSLTQLLVNLACLGTEWVLWLLLGLSILSLQVILDRAFFFWKHQLDADWLAKQIFQLLRLGEIAKARAIVSHADAPECIVLAAGLSEVPRGPHGVAEAMRSAQTRQRLRMEGEMNLLTMVATYAPIIGLMGSVLGVVNAVHHMSSPFSEQNLLEAATAGLSESLTACAAGLFVAILAGIGFHLLQRRVLSAVARTSALAHLLLAETHAGVVAVKDEQPELSQAA